MNTICLVLRGGWDTDNNSLWITSVWLKLLLPPHFSSGLLAGRKACPGSLGHRMSISMLGHRCTIRRGQGLVYCEPPFPSSSPASPFSCPALQGQPASASCFGCCKKPLRLTLSILLDLRQSCKATTRSSISTLARKVLCMISLILNYVWRKFDYGPTIA